MKHRDRKFVSSYRDCLLIFLLGILCYVNTLHVPFQLDDVTVIAQNPLIRILYPLQYLFRYDPSRFLTHWTFAVNYYWGGFHVPWFHWVNILLHCGNAILLYFLVKATLRFLPFPQNQNMGKRKIFPVFAAFIFLTHPLQTESVTYIVQRSVLLATAFYLAGLLGYIQLRMKFHWGLYFLILAVAILGAMTKPIFITLPLTIMLYEFYFLSSVKRQRMALLILPYLFILILVPLGIMLFALNYFAEPFAAAKWIYATRTSMEVPRAIYFLTEWSVVTRYMGLLFFPASQNILHAVPMARYIWEGPAFLSLCLIVSLLFCAVFVRHKKPLFSFGILWFFILMIPESSIFPLSDVMFEHRLYLAVGCFALIVLDGVAALVKRPRRFWVLGLIVLNLSILTYARNLAWQSPAGLLEDAIAKSPAKPQLHNALGIIYERERLFNLALI